MAEAKKAAPKKTTKKSTPSPAPVTVVLGSLEGKERLIRAEGDKLVANGSVLMQHVGNLSVLSTDVRAALSTEQTTVFDDVMYELRTKERPVKRVGNLMTFFNGEAHFAELADGRTLPSELENMGLVLTPEESSALTNYKAVRDKVLAFFKGLGPQYNFAANSTDARPLSVSNNTVSNGSYSVTIKQAQNIWKRAYAVWSGEDRSKREGGSISVDYSSRRIGVSDGFVNVGCQRVSRWQVEQLAISQGWI